jgi:hypothetical protein
MKKAVLALLALLVAGCATTGEPYSPPPPAPAGKSLVYLMRTSVSLGGAWTTQFYINDKHATSLYDRGYSYVYLGPGKYKISVTSTLQKKDYLHFDMPIKAGRTYYIEYTQQPIGGATVRNVVRALKPAYGQQLVERYTYKPAKEGEIPESPAN